MNTEILIATIANRWWGNWLSEHNSWNSF